MQLVEDLGLISMREVAFNKQSPQSGLIRHSDKFNYMLTGHLGVSVPKAEEGGGGGLDTPSEKKQPGRQLEEGAEADEGAAQEEEEEKEKEDDDDDDDDDDSGGGDGKEGALCGLEIDGSVQVWEEGKLLVIDNSFMHRTWNDSPDESRVIPTRLLPGSRRREARARHLPPPLPAERREGRSAASPPRPSTDSFVSDSSSHF